MNIQKSVAACAAILLIPACFIGAQILYPQTPLKAAKEGNLIIARLADGDSLFIKLIQISREYDIESGVILFNIGQLRDFSIGQYNPSSKRYVSQTFKLPWELVSMQGTISTGNEGGGLLFNCQATLADSTNGTVSGHLSKGVVSIMNEIAILKLTGMNLLKDYNVVTGLWELNF